MIAIYSPIPVQRYQGEATDCATHWSSISTDDLSKHVNFSMTRAQTSHPGRAASCPLHLPLSTYIPVATRCRHTGRFTSSPASARPSSPDRMTPIATWAATTMSLHPLACRPETGPGRTVRRPRETPVAVCSEVNASCGHEERQRPGPGCDVDRQSRGRSTHLVRKRVVTAAHECGVGERGDVAVGPVHEVVGVAPSG